MCVECGIETETDECGRCVACEECTAGGAA